MQSLYIPLMNSALREENRAAYIAQLAKLPVKRIFLALDRAAFFARGKARAAHCRALHDNICALQEQGYAVGGWIQALGFGDSLSKKTADLAKNYTRLRSVTGKEKPGHDMFCPESETFMADYLDFVRDVVRCGADLLMLDDDLCLSVRPGIGCFCKHHVALLEAALGESLDGADLPTLFFTGGENRYRNAWITVMGGTLRRFAGRVREAVDRIDPTVRVGFCAGYTSWDIEGVDALELTHILAGSTPPFLRFTGAPYWAARSVDRFGGQPLAAIIEEARAQERYCRESGVEVFFEADSYPRPRYAVPSSLLECFSLPLHASGGMGELAYLFDYHSSPAYETGYVKHRLYNKPLYDFIQCHFAGKTPVGIGVYHEMHKIGQAELPPGMSEKAIMQEHFNRGAELLGIHGIPTTYDAAPCGIAFGEEARHVKTLPQKLILDHQGAKILAARGFDVGLTASAPVPTPAFEWFGTEKVLLSFAGGEGYYRLTLSPAATVLSEFENESERFPAAYTYRTKDCELLVFAFDATRLPHGAATLRSYARADQLRRFCPPLPYIKNAPSLYQLCKQSENTLAMLFVNIGEDPVLDGEILLNGHFDTAELCGATGELKGDRITLIAPIPPYGAFAAIVKRT
ncbi:MAG: hypothetical protein E7585_07445 [Ruminococcaceae bacterium]|nr:hypothetical protein [Oscillospiraceae bacterium]